MNPSPNRQAVVVGLFTAAAIAILAGAVLTIGDINDSFTRKVTVTAVFDEVSGLKKGDNIWFSGVKVGTVKSMRFQEDSKVEVVLRVDREATPFIHKDVLAKVGSDGLIGNRIVVLYAGTPNAPTLEDGDVLSIGKTVSTEEIMATLQENNKNLLGITSDLKVVSGKLAAGEGTIGKLLTDESLYASVNDTAATLNGASDNAKTMTSSLSTFASKLNEKGSLPNDLVTDKTTYASLTATVTELHETGARASELVGTLATGVANPNSPVGALMGDGAAGGDLKQTIENLNRGTELLNEDLEAAQHNFLLRGFFKKRDKEAAQKARDGK